MNSTKLILPNVTRKEAIDFIASKGYDIRKVKNQSDNSLAVTYDIAKRNEAKELYHKQNQTDFSIKQASIKSAEDSGIKDKTVEEMIQWEDEYNDTYSEEEYKYCLKKEYDPITKTTTLRKVIR